MADLAAVEPPQFEPPPYPVRATGSAIPAFVGRAAERSSAAEAWGAARAGGRQVIFIGGEPGAGKSRLAAEDAADYRRELFDAVAAVLQAVGDQRPVVCVLEDLHWAGLPTLQLLSHVVQGSAAARLLLLC